MTNIQTLITSTNKAIMIALKTGDLDMTIINLYHLYNYYIDFTQEAIDSGYNYIEENKQLKEMISFLKYKYSDIICNYKVVNSNVGVEDYNNYPAPVVEDASLAVNPPDDRLISNTKPYYTPIKEELFTSSFQSANKPSTIIIYPDDLSEFQLVERLPKPNGNSFETERIIVNKEEFDLTKPLNLYMKRVTPDAISAEELKFRISDNSINKKYSLIHTLTLSGNAQEVNQPAEIGDNTIYQDNRTTTILTLDMFTSQLSPPYSDPENDLIDAIRIDSISASNQGIFLFDGVEVVEGQIITREDLQNELFTHVAPNIDDISSDVFNFSARDEGSLIWVN